MAFRKPVYRMHISVASRCHCHPIDKTLQASNPLLRDLRRILFNLLRSNDARPFRVLLLVVGLTEEASNKAVVYNRLPAASSIFHDHSPLNSQSKPRPRAGVGGL